MILLGAINSTVETFDNAQFTADLMPLFVQHQRLDDATVTAQDKIIEQYLKAAVAAAENACMRDVWLRSREWKVIGAPVFEFRRGAWKDVLVTGGAVPTVVGDAGPKSWGFSFVSPSSEYTVSAKTGYASFADIPVDMVSFILAAAGWMYEMRELATYSTMVQHAEVIPLYLLDPWTIPTYA